jgi:tetratricopeptide (TPR) repeat protein
MSAAADMCALPVNFHRTHGGLSLIDLAGREDLMMTTKQAGMGLFVIIALFFSMSLLAQAPAQTQPKPVPSPKEEAQNRMKALKDDPPAYIDAIAKFVLDFPYAPESESAAYWVRLAVPKPGTDPQKVRDLVNRFIQGIEPAPAALRVRYDSTIVQILLSNNLWAESVELAKKGIALLDETQYVDLERKKYEVAETIRKEKYPEHKPRPFSATQQVDRFILTQTGYYVSLGKGYVGLNKLDDAEAAFRKAYEIKPGMESAWGLADVYERRGKDADALEYMTFAALTGKLKAKDIQHFHDVYKKLHQGKLEGVEEYLDARYRKTYHNPVKGQEYQATSKRTKRVALAEFFTGGGCVPCIPFDFSFETALGDYSRNDFILLVYHWHAPYVDPLCNHGNDARVKYYGINSAPTVLIDGKKFDGKDDANSREEAEAVAQQVHGGLISAINLRLETPAQGRLKLTAQRAGETIKVTVAADEIKNTSPDVTLHLALVENEVTYSGENGLRFQPMVVRNLAKAAGSEVYGFKMDISKPNTVEYVFDLKGIMAENLRYYDEYPIERKKELSTRLDKATLDTLEFSFREQKHIIDPNNISVAAFLQDNKTKEILQADFLHIPPSKSLNPAKSE